MDTYTKLFGSILNSTIWREAMPTRIVWITMLAMCDKNGEVESSLPGLADRAKVSIEECKEALLKFLSPDEYSRTKDNEGRRIEEIDGGWRLLNHAAYRAKMGKDDRREYQRVKQAEYRARKALLDAGDAEPLTPEQRIARVREKIDREEKIQEEVRANHNPKYAAASAEPTEPPGVEFTDDSMLGTNEA